jgi:glycosyltransferase involved in cell wall biosynthesis
MAEIFDITVVTPSFNQGQFLEETLTSVLSQSGNFSLEYIVADGGSSDNSVEIIKKYDKLLKDNKWQIKCKAINFTWWSKKDNGQSSAINAGFRAAKGQALAWLNSDDRYEPGAIDQALKLLRGSNDIGLVYSNLIEIDHKGHEIRRHLAQDFDMPAILNHGNIVPQPAAFFSKEALDKVGYLNEKYHYAMDYDLWVRIGKEFKVLHSSSFWASFRLHESSKTVSLNKKFWREEREISLKHGGNVLSPLYINHLYNDRPVLMARVQKIMRGLGMLKRMELKDFKEKFRSNFARHREKGASKK